ncbi:MAG: serine--tRNA ligase [Pseudolabrys sp.]
MHDIKAIRDNPDAFDRALKRRGLAPLAQRLLTLDEQRRALITKLEQGQARRNAASKEIGQAKAKKNEAAAQTLMAEVAELKAAIPQMEAQEKEASAALERELAQIPNAPLDDVPEGADEHGNVEYRRWGQKRDYAFMPKQHFELGEALGQMDFELAAKLSGARFVVLQKGLARLERALGQLFLDLHTDKHGYTEVNPPLMVRDDTMFGTAQLPKFAEDQFIASSKASIAVVEEAMKVVLERHKWQQPPNSKTDAAVFTQEALEEIEKLDRRWLIPTAEVPLTNLVRESIVDENKLPMRLTACTPCFRAEAGAAGRDTRGMIRQHQFTKVELVSITTPEQSLAEHERMLACAEVVLQKLDLHYRVMTLCTGDMGFASRKTYDIEVWLPGQNMYREISSCSVCGDFQARRMDARYRGKDGKVRGFVHTLNGSGVAVGRALIAVMENYQNADGSITVPDALKPYMGGVTRIAGGNVVGNG